ncbi:hypothetical protein VPNG_04952 [Cytospora leucostoma]|uniref:Uncharacterized protein n=1 Tax=Cytospora leucostoma TaxID=1230097 RepID=A0A423X803_9PEZI|nr:hypothetical protein VPNG_04952 [Cytospora leucostoma]
MASSAPIVVAVSVSPIRSAQSTPARRRQLTPSIEASTNERFLILNTPKSKPVNLTIGARIPIQGLSAPKLLFPEGIASVQGASEYTHAHPSRTAPWNISRRLRDAGRHVLLPVDLRDPAVDLDGQVVRPLLYHVFPGTFNVDFGRQRSFILFQVDVLPQEPWPLTVGGLPITITDNTRGRGPLFPRQILAASLDNICPEFDSQDLSIGTVLLQLARRTNDEFSKNFPAVRLLELIYATDTSLYAVLADVNFYAVLRRLPTRIAGRFVGYFRNTDLGKPLWADLPARRIITPQPAQGIIDDTQYDILRPGICICSEAQKDHGHPTWFSTTSGILVENSAGDRFMTAASHGIDATSWKTPGIWQVGSGDSRYLGEAVQEISFTDVSLVKLGPGIDFINEPFENSAGEVPRFTRLFGEDPSDTVVAGLCYFDSPYTGQMEGVVVMISVRIESSPHPTEDSLQYVVYDWSYVGQEEGTETKVRPPNGTCGAAIWNDDGVVLGFYHFYLQEGPFAGFSATVRASEVVRAGYRLAR